MGWEQARGDVEGGTKFERLSCWRMKSLVKYMLLRDGIIGALVRTKPLIISFKMSGMQHAEISTRLTRTYVLSAIFRLSRGERMKLKTSSMRLCSMLARQ